MLDLTIAPASDDLYTDEISPADRAWWAGASADLDAPDPSSMPDWDALYHDRLAESALAYGIFGHPATEDI